jgi:hypothetical protein
MSEGILETNKWNYIKIIRWKSYGKYVIYLILMDKFSCSISFGLMTKDV